MSSLKWRTIPCLFNQLQLKTTLTGGQSFRWKQYNENNEYIGVFANILWILKQSKTDLMYRVVGELPYPNNTNCEEAPESNKKIKLNENIMKIRMKIDEPLEYSTNNDLLYPDEYYEKLLHIYFRLDFDLEQHYNKWCKSHIHFEDTADQFYAVRQLNQDPVENLFSFICSQNNHISRISELVEKICIHYGQKICDFEEKSYFNFPDISELTGLNVENNLRELGFGYRAKYIQKSAQQIMEKGGLKWFEELTQLAYKDAHDELTKLTGIGAKVADCICLMSFNHLQAIPVDTHIYQIAKKYLPQLPSNPKTKNPSRKLYTEIGDTFRNIYGSYAGWAQTVLFCAELRQFQKNEEQFNTSNAKNTNSKKKK